jgi:dTDP-4-dehydrorhamnose 3,5-epimerase
VIVKQTPLKDCYIVEPKVFGDERGYFFESFNQKIFEQLTGLKPTFVQDNQSKSSKGVLRGLHFQIEAYAQSKLVRVIQGSVLDIVVDIRKNSETFGQHFSIVLDAIDNKQLYVPKGFAHGFLVLEDDTIFSYKCDNYYNKEYERGIAFDSKQLNINWNISNQNITLSEKDKTLPTFEAYFK